jgi:hypothetical protein
MIKWILVAIGAAFVGGVTVFFMMSDIDLLSAPKNEVVALRDDMVVRNSRGVELRHPAGATLTFESQYSDEATLRLRIVTTKLDYLTPGSGDAEATYYAD